jgi:hypothetical protein
MSLMGVLIDKRAQAAMASDASVTFAHGLGGVPDSVAIRYVSTLASSTNWSVGGVDAPVDATNVTLRNSGFTTVPAMEIVTMIMHSMIQ